MSIYDNYIKEIEERNNQGLQAKPIDEADLIFEIIEQIKDLNHSQRKESIDFFIYNVLPGTTSAAGVKAKFLKEIILREHKVKEISSKFAFELLSHMKGGPSVEVLIDLALSEDKYIANYAAKILKTQVFLYEADTERLEVAYREGNEIAKSVIESYSKAEFFTELSDIEEEIDVVAFVAGVGDISTDLLSPGSDAHSRSDRELHGQCLFEHDKEKQNIKESIYTLIE